MSLDSESTAADSVDEPQSVKEHGSHDEQASRLENEAKCAISSEAHAVHRRQVPEDCGAPDGVLSVGEMLLWRVVPTDVASTSSANSISLPVAASWVSRVASETFRRRHECSTEDFVAKPMQEKKNKGLQVSDNSWIAKQRARRSNSDDSEDLVRSLRSILNKLTLETFPRMYQQLITCGISTVNHLEQLIEEVFEKATTQHHFIDMYADLCVCLHRHFEEHPVGDDAKKCSLKRVLLSACQGSFEKHLTPMDLDALEPGERTIEEVKYRTRMLGNIRFVGALANRKMLAGKVILAILEELLSQPTSEALETLAALLTVTGPTFDTPSWTFHMAFGAVLDQAKALSVQPCVDIRVRCILKDVLDLRQNGWKALRPQKLEGPKKLGRTLDKEIDPMDFVSGTTKQSGPCPTRAPLPSFDMNSYREEVRLTLLELRVSHDAVDAVQRIGSAHLPPESQSSEMCALLVEVLQLSPDVRKAGIDVVAGLFLGGHWTATAIDVGLRTFLEQAHDLAFDLPALSTIIREELYRGFAPLETSKLIGSSQLATLLSF